MIFVRNAADRPLARFLESELRRRGLSTAEWEPSTDATFSTGDLPVVFAPDGKAGRAAAAATWALAARAADAGLNPVLVLRSDSPAPAGLHGRIRGVVRIDRADASNDRVFNELFSVLLAPLPAWLTVRVTPTLLSAPTGVAWWTDDLLVVDERLGHVVHDGVDGERPVVPGLDDPHHLHLDRNKLLIANRSANEILLCELHGTAAAPVGTIRRARNADLAHPNGVHQGHGVTVIADTDNHRVIFTHDDPFDTRTLRFRAVQGAGRLRYPCAVSGDGSHIWVADTFHHRILAFNHAGESVMVYGEYGWDPGKFAYPVGLVRWRMLLVVADEEPRRLQFFSVQADGLIRHTELTGLGSPWITRPFGLAVNGHSQLAVADRTRRCIWIIDLEQALAAHPQGADDAPT